MDHLKDKTQLTEAAEAGEAAAQFQLGSMYANIEQDYAQAFFWIKKAAENEYREAQYTLGNMYFWGEGTKQSYASAFVWYHKAAEAGHIASLKALGSMRENGYGVVQGYILAFSWYIKAAVAGDVDAQYKVGALCEKGVSTRDNSALHQFGVTYEIEEDKELKPGFAEALFWYKKAAEAGHISAQQALRRLQRNM